MRGYVRRAAQALGQSGEAEVVLASAREQPNPRVAVEAWLVTALAADRLRADHRALSALDRALAIAEPHDVRRPFVALRDVRLADMLRHRRGVAQGDRAFLDGILGDLGANAQTGPPLGPVGESLTDRERMVLVQLATVQTHEEIAADLYISVNTVKSHARSVYRKLGVVNRRQAVYRARDLGLM